MKVTKCENGHFYDKEKTEKCPYCERNKDTEMINNEITSFFSEYKAYCGEKPYLFLSYSHKDITRIEPMLRLLKYNHFRFWYDEGIITGKEWADIISSKIKGCTQFIVFISSESVCSDNVKDEVHLAIKSGIDIIRVHVDDTELCDGLELQLDRKQALRFSKYNLTDFNEKFVGSINVKTIEAVSDISAHALKALESHYKIQECIADGGTAKVYSAINNTTGTKVLVKSSLVNNSQIDEKVREAFRNEKDILSRRISVYTPELFDCFIDDESSYLVENYISGVSLDMMNNLTTGRLVSIIIEIAKILKRYHENGIYHCDIKPAHIICNDEGCFLIDFGSAVRKNQKIGNFSVGTPGYAAPEQYISYNGDTDIYGDRTSISLGAVTDKVDERTDIFGLGRTIKRMLQAAPAGETNTAFSEFKNMKTVALFNIEKDYPLNHMEFSVSQQVDPLLQAIISKMTMERKSDRFKSMDEVITALSDYLKING